MHTSILLLTLLGAGALAHPHKNLRHQHENRDTPVAQWNANGMHYEEFVKQVTEPASQPAPSSAPVTDQNFAYKPNNNPAPSPSPAASPASSPAPGGSTGTPSTSSGKCTTSNTSGTSASDWSSPCSGGKPIIDIINEMRAAWMPSLKSSPLEWDKTQVQNSLDTSTSKVGKGGSNMAHSLPAPQNGQQLAQNEAQGDASSTNSTANPQFPRGPFESAMRMWQCELPQPDSAAENDPNGFHWPCDSQTPAGAEGSEAVGHADTLKNTGLKKVGCVYVGVATTAQDQIPGVWTCTFSNI